MVKKSLLLSLILPFTLLIAGCKSDTGKMTASTINKTPQDATVWGYYKQYNEKFGYIENINCLSENYHVIDGRKIALNYNFQLLEASNDSPYRYCFSFMFFDVTDEAESTPTFATNGANNVLDIKWGNNSVLKIKANYVEPQVILFVRPESETMQKELNAKLKFSVDVTTSTGQVLEYKFDCTERGPIDL